MIQLTKNEIQTFNDELAYLNIDFEKINQFENVFDSYIFDDHNIRMDLIDILSEPDNFWLTSQLILNIDLPPIQQVIIKELYSRAYPMMICSRGFSKCVTEDTWIVSSNGFRKMRDIIDKNAPTLTPQYKHDLSLRGENGFMPVEYAFANGKTETIKLQTSCGFTLEGTHDHPIRVVRNGILEWVELSDLKLNDYVPIDRSTDWFPNTNHISIDEAYMMGLILGDGGYTVRGRIGFTSADEQLVNHLSNITEKIWGKRFRKINKAKYDYVLYGVNIWDDLFKKYGFNSPVCAEKDIPTSILSAKKEVVAAFIRGLADTDGCFSNSMSSVQFAAKSESLIKNLQFILTRFGIISTVKKRYNKKYDRYYWYLYIFGENNKIFRDEIGFGLERKQEKLEAYCRKLSNPNKDVLPNELILNPLLTLREKYLIDHKWDRIIVPYKLKTYQMSYQTLGRILDLTKDLCETDEWRFLNNIYNQHYFYDKITNLELSENETYDVHIPNDHSFIANGFISHNTFLLALLIILKCVFNPGIQIAVIGVGLRQSKNLFEYVKRIWENAPLLRQMANKNDGPAARMDRFVFIFGQSRASFLPLGMSGATVRGERANLIIIDEYGDVPKVVVDTVVLGFGAVARDPVERMKILARIKRAQKKGEWNQDLENLLAGVMNANQIIVAGTAKFYFNHFAQEWEKRRRIILSRGDKSKLKDIVDENTLDNLDWKDYSIVRIPYNLIPEGFMDDKTIALARSSLNASIYDQEYMAVFTKDTDGFYKASLVYDICTANKTIICDGNIIAEPFEPMLYGDSSKSYILAIDPASQRDNAAFVILELYNNHSRVVYCWSTNENDFNELTKTSNNKELGTYYQYCASKVIDLMQRFNIILICMDYQGGGREIANILAQDQSVLGNHAPIYPICEGHPLWNGKAHHTDDLSGRHMIEHIEFANAQYTSESHHALRSDLEKRRIIFPTFDAISLSSLSTSESIPKHYDSLEDCMMEIQELKYELTIIEYTMTQYGRERWDTPEVKTSDDKKGRMVNDRMSALVMANYAARRLMDKLPDLEYKPSFNYIGNKVTVQQLSYSAQDKWASAPDWYRKADGKIGVVRLI